MKRAITEQEIIKLIKAGTPEIVIGENEILTPLASDRIKSSGLIVKRGNKILAELKMDSKKIIIGSDHTGVNAKKLIVEYLKTKQFEVTDVGTFSDASVDYPDFAYAVASRVAINEFERGIILDATGIPSSITANKIPGIRAATCYNEFSAKSSREHNNSNVLVMGAKTLGDEFLKSILDVWLDAKFLGDRHQKRLDKISAIEEKFSKKN